MNVLLSFNDMFKWRGPLDIKWDNPFGYLDHTWTWIEIDNLGLGWLQGRVAHFLHCNLVFCKLVCIYMLLMWHKNIFFPKVQPKVQWHDQQLPPTSSHWQQCSTMKIIVNLHLILKLLLCQKRDLILRCCLISKLLTNQDI
jgi:hypothetical protein